MVHHPDVAAQFIYIYIYGEQQRSTLACEAVMRSSGHHHGDLKLHLQKLNLLLTSVILLLFMKMLQRCSEVRGGEEGVRRGDSLQGLPPPHPSPLPSVMFMGPVSEAGNASALFVFDCLWGAVHHGSRC